MNDAVETFFEGLRSMGLDEPSLERTLHTVNDEEVCKIVESCNALIPFERASGATPFRYAATTSLSGGPRPCVSWECRRENLDAAARFAAFFADVVYIRNSFDWHVSDRDVPEPDRLVLIDDLRILWMAKPLLEAGIFKFAKAQFHFCEECYKKTRFDEWNKRAGEVTGLLEDEYLDRCQTVISRYDDIYRLDITGPEDVIEHGRLVSFYAEVPEDISRHLQQAKEYVLTRDEARSLGWFRGKINVQLSDLLVQSYYSRTYDCSYITDRARDIYVADLINSTNNAPSAKALVEGLAHSVPVVMTSSLQQIVTLRQAEWDAFAVYRDALKAVLEKTDPQNAKEIKDAVADTVIPGINEIRNRISKSRTALKNSLREDVVLGAGFVTAGLFGGLLGDVGQVVAALGGFKYASSVFGKVNELLREPDVARGDKWYFLWKLERMAKQSA